jgi:fatty-acyl-CoA synthase
MLGQMMDTPLLITTIMRHAETNYGGREIVSVTGDNPLHRYTYRDAFRRCRQLANALDNLGIDAGDRIGTLAWNDYRHFELYYAVSCSGRVLHTVNPRLFPQQVSYIVTHAEDKVLFTDPMFVPLLEQMAEDLHTVEHYVVLCDAASMPESKLPNVHCYEDLLNAEDDHYDWPELDERAASAMCYTSGTTGNPKGVVYNHRATVLHSYAASLPDAFALASVDAVLAVVPMFHANAWGLVYAAPMCGAKMVLPGPKMGDGEALQQLIAGESVTAAAGVPTIWMALLAHLAATGKDIPSLNRTLIGGAAVPASIIETLRDKYGVLTLQGWGMTEMSPLGTISRLKPGMEDWSDDEKLAVQLKAGRLVFGVEMKITDESGHELPWDGKSFGSLKVRGPWIASGYYRLESDSDAHSEDGWFETGDVATIDPDGFMAITDRTKDVIKSGGEWISSIELENTAVNHPDVAEAAVIGVPHPKWTERPLLVIVPQPGSNPWWVPDDVVFVDEIPHTATGKISKLQLREQFGGHELPARADAE